MGEFSEILDPDDFGDEVPVTVDKTEREFVSNFIKGMSLEESAVVAGMDYLYALELIKSPAVAELIRESRKSLEASGETQKRQGLDLLTGVIIPISSTMWMTKAVF